MAQSPDTTAKALGSQIRNVQNLRDEEKVSPLLSMGDRLIREGVGQVWSDVNNLLEPDIPALSHTESLAALMRAFF